MKSTLIVSTLAILAAAPSVNAQQAVILVRHAELQGAAMASAKDMALSEAGEARAKRLAGILKNTGVGAVYVTDFARTVKTAEPLLKEINREPKVLPKGNARDLVERLRKDHRGETVLMVGHTDTLPDVLKELGYSTEVKIDAQDYSNMFVVIPKSDGPPTFLRLRY